MSESILELVAMLALSRTNQGAFAIVKDAKKIERNAKIIRHWSEAACNGIERYDAKLKRSLATWTEDDESRSESAIERSRKEIRATLERYKLSQSPAFQNDPRGHVVKLYLTGGYWGL